MTPQIKLFGGSTSYNLASKIAKYYDIPLGKLTVQRFKDGELHPIIQESVRGCPVFFVQSTFAPAENLMELLLLIDAAKRASAAYIAAVVPYFGYARQDRKDKPRVSIAAKLIADLLTTAGADRVMTMDLHAPQIQGFFDIPVDHLDSSVVFKPYIDGLKLDNLIFAAPDVGSTKRTRTIAKFFNAEMVICDKHRVRANEVASMTLIGDVSGKDVMLIDDIVDTASTLCNAADMIMEKGANSVRAVCTHPILSGQAYEKIESSALTELVVCDTIPLKQQSDKIQVLSTSKLFAQAIKRITEYRSINELFTQKR